MGGAGGLRFRPMGSDEGGLEELVELSLSRASRSATRWSSSAIRHRSESKTAMRAACAVRGHGIPEGFRDRRRVAHTQLLRPYCTKGSGRERLPTITRSSASSSTTPRGKSSEWFTVVRFSTALVEVVRVSAIDTCLTTKSPVSQITPRMIESAHGFAGRSAGHHFTYCQKETVVVAHDIPALCSPTRFSVGERAC